jgi:uncharacterized SAM-binding protein YcdF (DUF218 family)
MKRRRGQRALIIALALVVLWPFAAWAAARALIVTPAISRADALVVLAGSATYLERTHHAARLFHAGFAPRIVLTNDNVRSGWSVAEQRNTLFVELAREELERAGVPADKIEIVPGNVWNTYDETVHVRDYARARNWQAILVVTSPYHSRRVSWTVYRVFAGTNVTAGVDAAPVGEQSPPAATWWLHGFGWKLVPIEYAKLIYYRVKY